MSTAANASMEGILGQLARDIITPKFANIKHTANTALDILKDEEKLKKIEAWELREICLQPLLLALESRARKLGHTALVGIQVMFKDERFRSSMETSDEDKWLPSQVLTVLAVTHSLPEDLQIEVMKLLLNMTVTASWCTSAKTIVKIAQILIDISLKCGNRGTGAKSRVCLLATFALFCCPDRSLDPDLEKWLLQILNNTSDEHVYIGSYQNCVMVQGAVQAAFITMLNKFVGGLVEMEQEAVVGLGAADQILEDLAMKEMKEATNTFFQEHLVDDREDVLADFKSNCKAIPTENLISEVVLILTFLTDRLEVEASVPEGKQALPLLLEGVNTVLAKVQSTIKHNNDFQELLWQRLCPCLISLLGEPKAEKIPGGQKPGWSDITRSTGRSTSSPNITQSSAKVIYSIAGELASLVGSIPPLRPVLESLFHKILMFPLPQNRHDALRVLKELMSDPQKVVSLIGSIPAPSASGHVDTGMALMLMLIDSIQQSSHVNDPAIVYTCVSCIDSLLASLDKIRLGEVIPDMLKPIKGSRMHTRRSMTSNPDDDGGSELTCDLYDESQDPIIDPLKEPRISENTPPESVSEEARNLASTSSQSPARAKFEAEERDNARQFVQCLRQAMPLLMNCMSIWEVDESLQDLAARFCSSLPQNSLESQSDASISGVVLNSDGVYVATITALKLNLRLLSSGYYVNRQNVLVSENDFLNEMFSSGLLLYLPPAWLRELYSQVVASSILRAEVVTTASSSVSAIGKSSSPLINFLQDIEGVGTTEERGRLMSDFREFPSPADGDEGDRMRRSEVGKRLAASVLSACWTQMLDILSVMLTDQVTGAGVGGGMALYSLSLLLATDSAQEDVRRARSAICASLDGFQRAARLCCALGLQQLCGSVFSQLARTSCVKEDFRATAAAAATAAADSKGQSKASVLAGNKPKLVKLHAAHLLSMDVVMTTGLEIGSHAADCWKHVFRCCAHISELEHIYFSQGNNQSSLPKVMPGSHMEPGHDLDGTEADGNCSTDVYTTPVVAAAVPVAPRINVPALIQQSGLESGWDNSLAAGGVLTFAQASKVLCGLSQEVDSFFENAADKLCLEALLSMLAELGEAMLIQLQKLNGAREGTAAAGTGAASRPPTNALHLYRLQQVLVRVVNSPRPLLHLLKVWSVVSTYLVQATGNSDHVISKMAVSSIHEFIVSLVSQREERPHFHVNEFVCKMFEDMLCLDLCDGDVQDQIVCCICELVEACSSQLQSGWRPLFGALRSVKIEYTTSEAVNEARQRHIAAVMDVFDVYLGMDNVAVFASATVDCVLCLLKYVHGPATFDSDFSGDRSDSGSDDGYGDAEGELENLCVPALKYLTRVCDILASMWHMPACPVFKGAHRIQVDSASRFVDGEIPFMNFKDFAEEFSLHKYQNNSDTEPEKSSPDKTSAEPDLDVPSYISNDQDQTGKTASHLPSSAAVESPRSCDQTLDNMNSQGVESAKNLCKVEDESGHQEVVESEGLCSSLGRREDVVQEGDQLAPEMKHSSENVQGHDSCIADSSDVAQNQSHESSGFDRDKTLPSEILENINPSCKKSTDHQNMKQFYRSQSLDEMDNESGILHVWFLLLDGLVSAINRCPKMVQSNVLTTLIDLLRSAAIVPGAQFSLHCMNHLLLPMMQSWLRRGSRCYGYWNTGINSFKQCCGLVSDLVVEFVTRFSDAPSLDAPLQLLLKQMLDVLIECVAQPVENISRLGCSCIRHILLSAGPHLSETLWQVGALAVRRALSVSTYNLQLLMALFHPNSDNFYGDIGQVKVATRKDCTVVDCLRLRQMARQVFLLDCQISSMPDVHYDTDQDKSFVFLLYPPGHQDSLNPDHISTRVPFRHVVVGLLSNQLLVQTVGSLLLQQGDEVPQGTDKHRGLPGQMAHMSTRNISQFLAALHDVFKLAQDFDARPGLKFLLQKVASLDVAANLYKQLATAVLFHMHALVEICAHLDNCGLGFTKAAIAQATATPQTLREAPHLADLKQQAHTSLAKPWASGNIFLPSLQSTCEELCESYIQILQDSGKSSILDKISEKPIFFLTAQLDDISQITSQAQLAAERTRSLKQHKLKTPELQKARSKSADSAQGMSALSVAVTRPQISHPDTDEDSNSEEETESKADSKQTEDDDDERIKSKREIRAEMQSKVYTVATDQVIENLMSQYKRHKHQRSMPNFIRAPRLQRKPKVPRREAVDEAIDKQQTSSIMKDSEARIQAWSDTLTAILQMTMNLPDHSFSALLPVTFSVVSQLILYAPDSALRDQLARCFTRLGRLYDFAPCVSESSQRQNSQGQSSQG